ncbi:DUF6279 family lipoprotein [Pseudoalteromonas luteoviolacea]|uniref:DUF6279 family lipoprotein n=1 Tax=Pseudoalteromonas luteoviolacea TaxID=43657 RepID=UPI001B375A15|nr:DUF6279 family lipoprotein [Pseudoalteromonas luteoviolacea]MBQ4835019.1 hypothetical protein [Pseudoalteromonas luteoviolacea]
MSKIVTVLLLILSLTACMYETIYKNADRLVLNKLEDFVTLTRSQEEVFLKGFHQLQLRHQAQYLPMYSSWLKTIEADWLTMDKKQIFKLSQQVRGHWYDLIQDAGPVLVPLLVSLDQKQRKQLISNIKGEMGKYKSRNERIENSLERFEDALGKLNIQQKAMISRHYDNVAFYREVQVLHNQKRLSKIEALLQRRLLTEAEMEELTRYIVNSPNDLPAHIEQQRVQRIVNQIDLLISLRSTLSTDQQAAFVDYLKDLEYILAEFNGAKL